MRKKLGNYALVEHAILRHKAEFSTPGARTMVGAILRRQLRKTGKFEWGEQLEEWLAARDWRTPVWKG